MLRWVRVSLCRNSSLALLMLPGAPTWQQSVLGALVGGGALGTVMVVFYLVRRKEGMGMGDVKLLAMIGAVLGPLGVMETILLASLVGLVMGLGFAVVTRQLASPFGFGPAIALAALVVLLAPNLLAHVIDVQLAAR